MCAAHGVREQRQKWTNLGHFSEPQPADIVREASFENKVPPKNDKFLSFPWLGCNPIPKKVPITNNNQTLVPLHVLHIMAPSTDMMSADIAPGNIGFR